MRNAAFASAILFAVHAQVFAVESTIVSKGDKVYPKADTVEKIGNRALDNTLFKNLPWVVQEVNGDWLWIGRENKGWVHRSQVLAARDFSAYLGEILKRNDQRAMRFYVGCTLEFEIQCDFRKSQP